MLNTAEDIHKSFLYGIRKSATNVVTPEKFVTIWNDWALKDWKDTNHFFDRGPEFDKIIRDKLQNLIRLYWYQHDDDYPWRYSLPNGSLTGYGREIDPTQIIAPGPGGGGNTDASPIVVPVDMPVYARHLSLQVKLDYDTNENQECSETGMSTWLDATEVMNDDIAVFGGSAYLKPSDSRIYYKIENGKIHIYNGERTETYAILLEYLKDLNEISLDDDGVTMSYDIDLTQDQLKEVIDSAVRIHLENLKSERYQTFLNEDKIRTR